MPYIKQYDRTPIDLNLDPLINHLRYVDNKDGASNYTISRLVSEVIGPTFGNWSYEEIARAIAVFECAKLEFYRRVAVPKEDRAILENGDLLPYLGASSPSHH